MKNNCKISLKTLLEDVYLINYLLSAREIIKHHRSDNAFVASSKKASKALQKYGYICPKGGLILNGNTADYINDLVAEYKALQNSH